MNDAEDSPNMEIRIAKRARHENLNTSQLNEDSHLAVPAIKQPPMHTKALRSVLKGVHSLAFSIYDLCTPVSCTSPTIFAVCLQYLLLRQVGFVC